MHLLWKPFSSSFHLYLHSMRYRKTLSALAFISIALMLMTTLFSAADQAEAQLQGERSIHIDRGKGIVLFCSDRAEDTTRGRHMPNGQELIVGCAPPPHRFGPLPQCEGRNFPVTVDICLHYGDLFERAIALRCDTHEWMLKFKNERMDKNTYVKVECGKK